SRLLDSIEDNRAARLEVVIADNASSDDTSRVARRFQKRLEGVTYVRAANNTGFDSNLRRAVGAATAPMCWFLGSDDQVYPGAISRVLDTIQNAPGALIVGDVHLVSMSGARISEEASTS